MEYPWVVYSSLSPSHCLLRLTSTPQDAYEEMDGHQRHWMWPLKITKEGREAFRDFCTECVTMMMRKMTLLTTQTVCASKLMHFLSTYLTPRPPVTGSQMDFTKACDRLMCVHIKADRTVMRPRTSVFIAELKKTTNSDWQPARQAGPRGLGWPEHNWERFTALLITTKLLSTRYDLDMRSMCWCGFTGEGGWCQI